VKRLLALLGLLLLTSSFAGAADVSGTWLAKAVDRTVTLELDVDGAKVTGTLEGVQGTMQLSGTLTDDAAEGTVTNDQGSAYFKFVADDTQLRLTLANLDADGKPMLNGAAVFALKRPEAPKASVAFQIAGFATPPSDPLLGIWVLGNARLELKGKSGKYTGTLQLGGSRGAVSVAGSASGLKGTWTVGKAKKSITARMDGDRLVVTVDGKRYVLNRVR
jgi:small nuclear ribonucleoprotein (snRNP)-like protein